MNRTIALIAALLMTISLSAQALDMMAPIPADSAVRVGRLDNGMTYYIRHNAKPEKQAEFYIFHNVGAMQEEDSQVGLAHFLEHMAFNGTKNMPGKKIIDYLETIGVKFGVNLNAGTGQEITLYNMSSVPVVREGIIDTALLILHDWSHFITLDSDEIDKERGVIIEERRTRDDAMSRMKRVTDPVLYNNTKYAYRDVIGTEENLRKFPYKELEEFYHKWYRADMQSIVVVGDIDVDQMEDKIKKLMADIPAVQNPANKAVVTIDDNKEPMIAIATDPEQSSSMATLYIKCGTVPKELKDKVVVRKMNNGISLMQLMVNERLKEISQKPDAPFVNAAMNYGSLTTTCDVVAASVIARDGELPKAFESLYGEMERVVRHQFTQGELERAVADVYREAQATYDNRNDRRSENLVWDYISNYYDGAPMPDAQTAWRVDSTLLVNTTLDDINALAKTIFVRENQVVIVNAPKKDSVAVPTQQDMIDVVAKVRASTIEPYADNTVKEPLVSGNIKGSPVKSVREDDRFRTTEWILKNGVKVVLKKTDFKSDELMMYAFSAGGLSNVPTAQYFTGEMIVPFLGMSGVGKFSSTELSKQLSGQAVAVQPFISEYVNGIDAACSPKDVQTMLQLVYLYFAQPRFEQADFAVLMDRYRAMLTNAGSNLNYVFNDSVSQTLYDHNPRRVMQSLATLKDVKYDYVKPIYSSLFNGANNFTFLFVGAIDQESLKPLIEKYIGAIATTRSKLSWKNDGVQSIRGKVTNEFKTPMQTPKTTVGYIYTANVDYTNKNLLITGMLQQILDIRCTESIREQKGGTYGVSVRGKMNYVPNGRVSLSFVFDTDPKMADELMPILESELVQLAESGPTGEDLNKIKEFMLKQHKDNLKKNTLWVKAISEYQLSGVDITNDYSATVNAITSEEIKKFASDILSQGNECRVIMNPKE